MSLCSPPLIETYREGAVCPSYACLYSSVLSLLQKPVNQLIDPVRMKGWVGFIGLPVIIVIIIWQFIRCRNMSESLQDDWMSFADGWTNTWCSLTVYYGYKYYYYYCFYHNYYYNQQDRSLCQCSRLFPVCLAEDPCCQVGLDFLCISSTVVCLDVIRDCTFSVYSVLLFMFLICNDCAEV